MKSILVDAGPLIALFSVNDHHHARYNELVRVQSDEGLRLLSTWPCIVEASYLLSDINRFALLEWVELGGLTISHFEAGDLGSILSLMKTYTEAGKIEMDFADASLVWLASETGINEVMTVDARDFSRYRTSDGKAFVIL